MEIVFVALVVVVVIVVVLGLRLALRAMRPQVPENPAPSTTAVPVIRSALRTLSPEAAAEISRLIAVGRRIEAIKVYREHTSVGLKEAKDAVEAWPASSVPYAPSVPAPIAGRMLSASVSAEIDGLLAVGRKIEAIKVYREHTGVGLKEAKDAVEAWR
ncbi:ribosomal protein L7/L12 [Microbacterium sp.]|uniref:ribosomal protein L7/L12 n=1 Tax=Microbacterium sp. TaxID=51671 RepID=UPI0039E6128C